MIYWRRRFVRWWVLFLVDLFQPGRSGALVSTREHKSPLAVLLGPPTLFFIFELRTVIRPHSAAAFAAVLIYAASFSSSVFCFVLIYLFNFWIFLSSKNNFMTIQSTMKNFLQKVSPEAPNLHDIFKKKEKERSEICDAWAVFPCVFRNGDRKRAVEER